VLNVARKLCSPSLIEYISMTPSWERDCITPRTGEYLETRILSNASRNLGYRYQRIPGNLDGEEPNLPSAATTLSPRAAMQIDGKCWIRSNDEHHVSSKTRSRSQSSHPWGSCLC